MNRKSKSSRGIWKRYHFRYRRFHSLHLDTVGVVLLTVAGWSLCHRISDDDESVVAASPAAEIVVGETDSHDTLVRDPSLFAFSSSVGFAHDIDLDEASFLSEDIPLLPAPLEEKKDQTRSGKKINTPWPGVARLMAEDCPAPLVLAAVREGESTNRLAPAAVHYSVVGDGTVTPPNLAARAKSLAGKSFLARVVFGPDGHAAAVILGPNTLSADDAAYVEREAMGMTGKAGKDSWLSYTIFDQHAASR